MIAISGLSKKDYLNRQLAPDVEDILKGRAIVTEKLEKAVEWVPGQVEQVKSYCTAPIVAGGDTIGAVYLLSKVHFLGEAEQKAAETAVYLDIPVKNKAEII